MARYLNELDAVTSLQNTDIILVEQNTQNKQSAVTKLVDIQYPVGMVIVSLLTSAPDGWLLCDGSAVDRTTYADLFALIGETYGIGDGSTTFNLPDYRGQFLRGAGTHGSQTMANGTAYNGGSLGDWQEDKFQGHSHRYYWVYDDASKQTGSSGCGNNRWNQIYSTSIGSYSDYDTPRIKYETKPTSYSVNYIIKY